MASQPLISVLIPTYNRERLLPIAIDSVRAQTLEDWELIVVDDRSTDGTAALVESYSQRDPRIRRVVNERARGPSGARNFGLTHARGRYVALLDSDDQWEPFHLREMAYYLEKYPGRIDLMTANPLRKRRATEEVFSYDQLDLAAVPHEKLEECYVLDTEKLFDTALNKRIITTQTIVAKREVFERIPWAEDVGAGEDCLFPLEVARHKIKVGHIQKYHVIYWTHDDNLSNANRTHSPERRIKVYLEFEKFHRHVLADFPLTPEQRRVYSRKLAEFYVWQLGYNGYLEVGDVANARKYFWKGIQLRPLHAAYWKTLLSRGFIKRK